jgi:hypothetical protein
MVCSSATVAPTSVDLILKSEIVHSFVTKVTNILSTIVIRLLLNMVALQFHSLILLSVERRDYYILTEPRLTPAVAPLIYVIAI